MTEPGIEPETSPLLEGLLFLLYPEWDERPTCIMRERACQVVVTRQLRWQNVSMGVVSGEIFPPLSETYKILEVEIYDVAIYPQEAESEPCHCKIGLAF